MSQLPDINYKITISHLKEKIRKARLRASIKVNQELLEIYWEIGITILTEQKKHGWGAKIIDNFADDLRTEFPDMRGFSVRNLKYMRAFAEAYPDFESSVNQRTEIVQAEPAQLEKNKDNSIVQANLAQLSWYHHTTLLDKVKETEIRLFYIQQTIENGWSRDVMVHQVESGLHLRQGKLTSNFKQSIAPEQSELVQQIFKDPYKFEFIYLGQQSKERDLEDALTSQMTKFLLELGQWFAFMGRQYKMVLGEKEYYFDLLFYHTRLKRYIVIDLKIDEFKPEYKGKMEFYLNLADDHLREKNDEPSIGLILCKTKDGLVAEYALRDSQKPIGIAEYTITEQLPKELKGELPSIEELEAELEREAEEFLNPLDKKMQKLKELSGKLKTEGNIEKQNKENTLAVYKNVVVILKNKIQTELAEIIDQFDELQIMIWTYSQGFKSDEELLSKLQEFGTCNEFRISIQLHGFKKAGPDAFYVSEDILITMGAYRYTCVMNQGANQTEFWKKQYNQYPSLDEIDKVIEALKEKILDYIIIQLERLSK